jgi:aminomethyltransferase
MEDRLLHITLENSHRAMGAKMVPFAGYLMPLQYSSVLEEHKTVRENVGVFDVSHMGEFLISGPHALGLIQRISSNDASKLKIGEAQYAYMPNHTGGIVDDLITYRLDDNIYMLVVNASNIEKDWDWIQSHNTEHVLMENSSGAISLFAVQGPKALQVLQKMTVVDLSKISYYAFVKGSIGGVDNVIISCTGYTGAGGFELYVPNKYAKPLWDGIFEAGQEEGVKPIGLGARDTLRLEMGYCLYGNDIDDTTSPLEAGLGWVTKFNKDFINSGALLQQKESGVTRKLMGFAMVDKGIPRAGYAICDARGNHIGMVTSGSQSPTLEKGIGLGYVPKAMALAGTAIFIQIRDKQIKAIISKLPFVKK